MLRRDRKPATTERKLPHCGGVCHQLCLQTLPAVFTNTVNSDLLRVIPPTGLTKFK